MKNSLALLAVLAAVSLTAGCKSAALNSGFDVAKAIAGMAPAIVQDAKEIVTKAKDTFDNAKTNVLNAAKGTVTTATQ